jgi:hypothetical protein
VPQQSSRCALQCDESRNAVWPAWTPKARNDLDPRRHGKTRFDNTQTTAE